MAVFQWPRSSAGRHPSNPESAPLLTFHYGFPIVAITRLTFQGSTSLSALVRCEGLAPIASVRVAVPLPPDVRAFRANHRRHCRRRAGHAESRGGGGADPHPLAPQDRANGGLRDAGGPVGTSQRGATRHRLPPRRPALCALPLAAARTGRRTISRLSRTPRASQSRRFTSTPPPRRPASPPAEPAVPNGRGWSPPAPRAPRRRHLKRAAPPAATAHSIAPTAPHPKRGT